MEGLRVVEDGTYLDGTFGRGGHARGVLQRLGTGGRLLLMDKDPEAIAAAEREFAGDPRVAIRRGSFTDLAHWSAVAAGLDGILFDLGVSSPQLDVAERGFSFGKDGPLDMRMDPDSGESAAQWLARAAEAGHRRRAVDLWRGAHEPAHRAQRSSRAAREKPIERTGELARLHCRSVVPRGKHEIHPATRTFQAIRIHINRELADLETRSGRRAAALKPRRPAGRDQLPFAGRPHRQAFHRQTCEGAAGQSPLARGRTSSCRRCAPSAMRSAPMRRNRRQSARPQRGVARGGEIARRGAPHEPARVPGPADRRQHRQRDRRWCMRAISIGSCSSS